MKHTFTLILFVIALTLSLASCGNKTEQGITIDGSESVANVNIANDETTEEPKAYDNFTWPTTSNALFLPVPESTKGEVAFDTSSGLAVYVGYTSRQQYETYINECIKLGFDVDYQKETSNYFASNKDGYNIQVKYKEGQVMYIELWVPDDN